MFTLAPINKPKAATTLIRNSELSFIHKDLARVARILLLLICSSESSPLVKTVFFEPFVSPLPLEVDNNAIALGTNPCSFTQTFNQTGGVHKQKKKA